MEQRRTTAPQVNRPAATRPTKKTNGLFKWILFAAIAVFLVVSYPKLVDTVEKGFYQVKQAAFSGNMTAKMTPGIWPQLWGDIEPFPKAETFYFTKDKLEGTSVDQSIEVRFVDGSICNISGTCRIVMPIGEQDAIDLITVQGYRTYKEVELKLILPTIRNVLRLTANMMTAEQSYSEKRTDYITMAREQIALGLFDTVDEPKEIVDLVSGKTIMKNFKVVKLDSTGSPVISFNPLKDSGIKIKNFDIKVFDYESKVKAQIATQQQAKMDVATAKANAQLAEQDKITIEAQGKAKVATARYQKETLKIQAVVDANKAKEVAIIEATQKKAVAKLDKEAAEFTKKKQILIGEGNAKRKNLEFNADGGLLPKLDALIAMNRDNANAFATRKVPAYYISGGGSGGADSGDNQFMTTMNAVLIKALGIDMDIKEGVGVDK